MRKPITFWLAAVAIAMSCLSVLFYFIAYDEYQRQTTEFAMLNDKGRFSLTLVAGKVWLSTPMAIAAAILASLLEKSRQ